MIIELNNGGHINPKDNIKYPVFVQHTDGDIYMFLTDTKALVVKHKLPCNIGVFADNVISIRSRCWELLPKGYQVTFTQE